MINEINITWNLKIFKKTSKTIKTGKKIIKIGNQDENPDEIKLRKIVKKSHEFKGASPETIPISERIFLNYYLESF